MLPSRNTHRRRGGATVTTFAEVGAGMKAAPAWFVHLPGHLRGAARDLVGRIRGSRLRSWAVRVALGLVGLLVLGLWEQALLHGAARPVDPKLEIPVRGAPAAVVSYSGLIVTASEAGTIRALDPVRNDSVAEERQLGHSVTALASRSGALFALGGGTITRLRPDLTVALQRPLRSNLSTLAAGSAGLWASGGTRGLVRVDPVTLDVSARVPIRGRVGGIAVSREAVWATLPGSSELVVARPRRRGGSTTRRLAIGCAAGPITIAGGYAWALCSSARRVVAIAVDSKSRSMTIPVGVGATLLASGNHSLYVGSPTTETISQYGLTSRTRVGDAIPVETLPSSLTVDLHAVWVASKLDHSLQRLDLAGLRMQRQLVKRWDTIGELDPTGYLVAAIVLTMLLGQAYLLWRSGNPDAGLPPHEVRDIALLACDPRYYQPLSTGEPVETSSSTGRSIALNLHALNVSAEDVRTHKIGDLPPDRRVQRVIEAAHAVGRVKRFMNHAPAAGGLLRAPRATRLRVAKLRQRFQALEPFTVCGFSGTWTVSRTGDDLVRLRLPQLVDRDWMRWRPVPVAEAGWITVTCPTSALSELGRDDLSPDVTTIRMSVLAVPSRRREDETMEMRLVVAYY